MISIITAHYNSSEKINNLIDSLQKQTNKDFEWIVVDDCSRDVEFSVMKEKVLKAGLNAKVLQNEKNGGPGVARNNGIKHSHGDYIVFVDCDDVVSNDFVSVLELLSTEKDTDVIAFDYVRIQGDNRTGYSKIDGLSTGSVSVETFLLQAKTGVCGAAFRSNLICENNILFPELYRYEDWVFNVRAILKSTSIWYEKKELYFYLEAENSLVTSGKHDAGECALQAYNIIEMELNAYDKRIKDFLFIREILYVNAVSKATRCNFQTYKNFMKSIQQKSQGWQRNNQLQLLSSHQRMVLFLLKTKLYGALWMGIRIISKR